MSLLFLFIHFFPQKFGSPVLLELSPGTLFLSLLDVSKAHCSSRKVGRYREEEPPKSRITTTNYHCPKTNSLPLKIGRAPKGKYINSLPIMIC